MENVLQFAKQNEAFLWRFLIVIVFAIVLLNLYLRQRLKINKELNMSVLINIHHVDLALKYADRVIGIKAGEIVYDGAAKDVTNEVLKQIYGRELAADEVMGA